MVEAVYVINKESGIPLYHKSYSNNTTIEEGLLGGFISAIANFGKDVKIGNIKSFDTDENRLVLVGSEDKILAVIYDPTKDNNLDVYSLAGILIEEFNKSFPSLKGNIPAERINTLEFDSTIETVLSSKKKPFFYEVMEWAKKEYGGELFIRQNQFTKDEQSIVIDIVLDRGKMKTSGLVDKISSKIIGEDFSKDVVYIKVIDGIAGSGEAKEFFNACKTFGRRRSEKQIPSYFPTIAGIVAKDYSPTFERILRDLNKKDEKYILIPEAAPRIAKMINRPPKTHQCQIQCWKWATSYPELVYE